MNSSGKTVPRITSAVMSWKQFRHSDRSGHSERSQSIQRKMKSASNEHSSCIIVSKKNRYFFQNNSQCRWGMTEMGWGQGVENGGEPRLISFPTRKKPAPPDRWRQPVVVQDSVVSKNTEREQGYSGGSAREASSPTSTGFSASGEASVPLEQPAIQIKPQRQSKQGRYL